MRQGATATLVATTMMVSAMVPSGEIQAQESTGLRLGTWAGEMEAGGGVERQQTHSDGALVNDWQHRRLRGRLNIRNQGFSVVDPRLFSGSLGLTLDAYQDHDQFNGADTSSRGTLNGYAFDSTFLGGKPYNGTLYANRNQNILVQPFGGRTAVDYHNLGTTLRLREDSFLKDEGIPYFSSNLRAYQEHIQQSSTGVGQTFERNEIRNVFGFDAHKGFETSDLELRYEYNDLNNIAFAPGSFQTQTGNLNYSLDFGSDLNRRWDSRLTYTDRTGLSPTKFYYADEQVRVDHYKNLYSNYRYLFTRIETPAGTTDSQNANINVQHQLHNNLTSNALALALHQDLPTGTRTTYAGQLDFNYQRKLSSDSRVYARLGARNQVDDNVLTSSRIDIVDEPHAAPNPIGGGAGFLLAQPFVIQTTIVMFDVRGGARLPTTPGVDYDIVPEGNLTRIVPILGSLVIQAGDPLVVSYTYEVNPSIKYSTDSRWISLGMDFRWIAFFVGHEQWDQTLISGTDNGFLEDRRRDTAQLDLRGAWEAVRAELSAAATRYDATRLAYTEQRFTQLVWYKPWSSFVLGLNAEESYRDYTLPERQSDTRSLQLTLDWFVGGWQTTTLVGRRILRDSLIPTETISEASFRARLTYGKLEISAILALNDHTRGTFQTTDRRMGVQITRRF